MMVARSKEQERRGFPIRIRWPYVILFLLMVLFTVKFIQKTQELRSLTAQANALRVQNQQTIRDNARIKRAIRYYKTTGYVESEARARFAYTLPGDVVILPSPHAAAARHIRRPVVQYVAPPPIWKQWWAVFFS
jgi:cell division protein FtsB